MTKTVNPNEARGSRGDSRQELIERNERQFLDELRDSAADTYQMLGMAIERSLSGGDDLPADKQYSLWHLYRFRESIMNRLIEPKYHWKEDLRMYDEDEG